MKTILLILSVVISLTSGCGRTGTTGQDMDHNDSEKKKNHLANETSPYLLQHQYNPVDWYPWGEEAFAKAKSENKLMLISIGYSACHWCHVMEHESFENDSIAKVMNEKFVCIKVDREERPDVDQVYINAVQLLTGRAGWPLNCFALPDGRPFQGGTYFAPEKWSRILDDVNREWNNNPDKVYSYADKLTAGVRSSELVSLNESDADFSVLEVEKMVEKWSNTFDMREGGTIGHPKFPKPNTFDFLLKYAALAEDDLVRDYALLSLDKMAFGGIYDQIGGGFARYSTDANWKAPHFEKMLYDNAQMMSLYSQAYTLTKKDLYKNVVYESFDWLTREMMSDEHAFYSALDADSEGEEGKFYVWKKDDLDSLLGADFVVAERYYNINNFGRWEHGNYILLRKEEDEKVAKKLDISESDLAASVSRIKEILMKERDTRVRPGLDDKTLTSWNALMIKGLADAYEAFADDKFLDLALKNAKFILSKQKDKNSKLMHSYKNGRSTIDGFLEDYCFTAEAFIALYQITFDEKWLQEADQLAQYAVENFFDESSGMFFFTSKNSEALIARKMEVNDAAIPASNSSMAKVLLDLGHLLDKSDYLDKSRQMLRNVAENMEKFGASYSNWGIAKLREVFPYFEIAIAGDNAMDKRKDLVKNYIPNRLILGDTNGKSNLSLLEYKYVEGDARIYVCVNKSCQMPVAEVSAALKQLD